MVLMIIDAQKLITNDKLYNFNKFVLNVKELISKARDNKKDVTLRY